MFGTGKKKVKKECDECDIELEKVTKLEFDPNNKQCQFNDFSDNCTFFFSYDIFNNKRVKYSIEKG